MTTKKIYNASPKYQALNKIAIKTLDKEIKHASCNDEKRRRAIIYWIKERIDNGLPFSRQLIERLDGIDTLSIINDAENFQRKTTEKFAKSIIASTDERQPNRMDATFAERGESFLEDFSGGATLAARIDAWLENHNRFPTTIRSAPRHGAVVLSIAPDQPSKLFATPIDDETGKSFETSLFELLLEDEEWELARDVELAGVISNQKKEPEPANADEEFYLAIYSGKIADMDKFQPDRFRILFSREPRHLAEMSSGQRWKSCLAENEAKAATLVADAREGTFVAYLVAAEDAAAAYPFLRIAVRPMRNSQGDLAWVPEGVYGQSDRGMAGAAAHSTETAKGFLEKVATFVELVANKEAAPGTYRAFGGIQHEKDQIELGKRWTRENVRECVRKLLDSWKDERDMLRDRETSEQAGLRASTRDKKLLSQAFKHATSILARLQPLVTKNDFQLRIAAERLILAMSDERVTKHENGFGLLEASERIAMPKAAERTIANDPGLAVRANEWRGFAEAVAERITGTPIETGDVAFALAIAELRSPGIVAKAQINRRHPSKDMSSPNEKRPVAMLLESLANGVLPDYLKTRRNHAAEIKAKREEKARLLLEDARTKELELQAKHPSREEIATIRKAIEEARSAFPSIFRPPFSGQDQAWNAFVDVAEAAGAKIATKILATDPRSYGPPKREGALAILGFGKRKAADEAAATAVTAMEKAMPAFDALEKRMKALGATQNDARTFIMDIAEDRFSPKAAERTLRTFGIQGEERSSGFILAQKPTIDDLVTTFSADEAEPLKKQVAEAEKNLHRAKNDPGFPPPGISAAECERLSWTADVEAFDRETRSLRSLIAKREEPYRLGLAVRRSMRRDAIGPIPSPAEVLSAVMEELKSVAQDAIKPNDTDKKTRKRNGATDER
jgi:hypothetical protein